MPKRYKVLITGSNGMLGTDLSDELKNDYGIYGTDLIQKGPKGALFYKCDILDRKAVSSMAAGVMPYVIVHTAAWTNVDGCELDGERAYEVNSIGTENVAIAAKEIGAVMVYISTDFVFHGNKKNPYGESDRPNPVNIYGRSKLRGEDFVRNTLKKYFIIRTSWLYGSHGINFVDQILSKARTDDTIKVVEDQKGSPTYTKDLARAIHVVLDGIGVSLRGGDLRFGIYHVTNYGSATWYEFARHILRLAGSGTKVVPIQSKELARPAARPVMSVLDNSKFARATGYRMRSWKSALREYLDN